MLANNDSMLISQTGRIMHTRMTLSTTAMFESNVHDWANLATNELEKAQTCPNVHGCDKGQKNS